MESDSIVANFNARQHSPTRCLTIGGTARIRNPDSSCRGLPTCSPLTSNERAAR